VPPAREAAPQFEDLGVECDGGGAKGHGTTLPRRAALLAGSRW
jgi:hypothetical protein